jgi:hypothetical protein
MTIASSRGDDHVINRCPFPLCINEEHETGPHKFGRPRQPMGTLRLVQEFCYRGISCDLHPDCRAEAFYADMFGFGWALCAAASKKLSVPAVTYSAPIPSRPSNVVRFPAKGGRGIRA